MPSDRRTTAALAGAGLIAAIGLGCAAAGTKPEAAPEPMAALAAAQPQTLASLTLALAQTNGDTLAEPVEVRAENGLLDVEMEVVWNPADQLRYYKLVKANGKSEVNGRPLPIQAYPGPTFRVQQGDSVRIHFTNNLPQLARGDMDCIPIMIGNPVAPDSTYDQAPNCFHGANTTNIHYHGFHISPNSPADNVLLQLAPGDTFQYAFRIQPNQAQGTHWYHPHKHGSVALQVTNGMAGAFIVEGDFADVPQIADAVEHLLVIQEVGAQLDLVDQNTTIEKKLINGQSTPVIHMRPNEVQRWRLVNASVKLRDNYRLAFRDGPGKEPSMYAIARDGVPLAPENFDQVPDTNLVAPGNRLDVLVQAPAKPGIHALQGIIVGELHEEALRPVLLAASQDEGLVKVVVTSDGTSSYVDSLPAALPPLPGFLDNLGTPDSDTTVVFSEEIYPGRRRENPPRFYLGKPGDLKQQFSMNTNDPFIVMPLGDTQDWKVVNLSTGINHPFHIHINPFQVLEVEYPDSEDPNAALYEELNAAAERGHPIWMDTIALPQADAAKGDTTAGYVIVRQKFEDYTGDFVMHCHILGHEERGMMQLLRVE